MIAKAFGIAVMAATAFTSSGCLQKDTTHTLYLAPDGSVRWMTIEKDVRSDESQLAARRSEEDAYLASATAGTHGVGLGLAVLDPLRQESRVIRRERPFVAVSEADFARIDKLFDRLLSELRVPGRVTMTGEGSRTTVRIHLDVAAALADDSDRPSPVAGLFDELAAYRIVLTSGRFVSAVGFTLKDDGMTAVPVEITDDELTERGGIVDMALTWGNH
jgi:hypothetical protein